MTARIARPLARRYSPSEADRLYRPFCWHPPEPVSTDPLGALAADFVPDPNRSEGEARRWRHGDLAGLDGVELWRERERAAFMAAWLPEGEGRAWAEQRLKAVAGEQARRKGAARAR